MEPPNTIRPKTVSKLERRKPWTTLPEPDSTATRTKRGLNLAGIIIAVVCGALLVPATYKHQMDRIPPVGKRQWRMYDLVGIKEMDAIKRFGRPNAQKEYQMVKGSIVGPLLGQKHYYPLDSPDLAKATEDAQLIWRYPQYTAIRELTWILPDSYLTIWFHEPRAEIKLGSGDDAVLTFPTSNSGEWVALDNYRLGKDLVAPQSKGNAAAASPAAP